MNHPEADIWQIIILVYLATAVVAVYLAAIRSSPVVDVLAALGITLIGLGLIRRLKHPRNPNT
jgi:hypothetical protein